MAQTTSTSGSRAKRNSSSGNRKRSSTTTRGSTRSKPRNSTKSRNGSSQTSRTVVAELAAKAKPQAEKVKRTGDRVSHAAAKAKTPLIAGGAALAGLAGGVALKSRTEHRRPVEKLRTRALPKSLRNIDLSKVDLHKIAEIGRQVRSIGEQVGDVADAADKTRKKHN
jgi:hypothetical protein